MPAEVGGASAIAMKETQERRITSAPSDFDRQRCQSFAYVGSEPLASGRTLEIHCNCGSIARYDSTRGTNVCQCETCGTVIGMYGVSGGPGSVPYRTATGETGDVPIQGYPPEDEQPQQPAWSAPNP